jgi:dTDP-4-amino-4,6-dideoxy-D-glucose/dTDP-4-amino-2,4-dideoxy-beta-L-xylose transaminase
MNKIPLFKVFMSQNVHKEVKKVLYSGFVGQGSQVQKFEQNLKNYIGNDMLCTTNSGTSALHLALHTLKKPYNLKDGDEVLCTPLTCTATNWPVLANNFKIKWVDVNPNNLNMDLDDLERKITPKTKVIMVVHWGGYPVDLDRIKKIQQKTKELYGFEPIVIEDCAHGIGSTYKGKRLGNHGNLCMFSFQAIKHITAVDGGMLTLPNQDLYDRAKLLRWYGIDRNTNKVDFRCEEDIKEWGFKFHMNDISATIGMENLKSVDDMIIQHQDNAKYYNKHLDNSSEIRILERGEDRESSFWIYSMLVDKKEDFMKWMKECGIVVSQVHERNDIHSCVKEFKTHLPMLDKVIPELISIPVGWWVTNKQREYIVDCIKKGW